jgi:hypothetical protein
LLKSWIGLSFESPTGFVASALGLVAMITENGVRRATSYRNARHAVLEVLRRFLAPSAVRSNRRCCRFDLAEELLTRLWRRFQKQRFEVLRPSLD